MGSGEDVLLPYACHAQGHWAWLVPSSVQQIPLCGHFGPFSTRFGPSHPSGAVLAHGWPKCNTREAENAGQKETRSRVLASLMTHPDGQKAQIKSCVSLRLLVLVGAVLVCWLRGAQDHPTPTDPHNGINLGLMFGTPGR